MVARNHRKRPLNYEKNDLVILAIPKIDRSNTDRPTLPCKIIEKLSNGKYKLGCKNGILENFFEANELMPLEAIVFPELDQIPLNKISIRNAANLQAMAATTGTKCSCAGACDSYKCRCKKAKVPCNSGCHPKSTKCTNKD